MTAQDEHRRSTEGEAGGIDPHASPMPSLGGSFENTGQVRRPDGQGALPGLERGPAPEDDRASTMGNSNATTVDGAVIFPSEPDT